MSARSRIKYRINIQHKSPRMVSRYFLVSIILSEKLSYENTEGMHGVQFMMAILVLGRSSKRNDWCNQ